MAIDVGTGTQDILVFEAGTVIENAVQLIMPSPTALLAEQVKQATAEGTDLFLTGVTMGGGPDHWAVEAHLRKGLKVYATPDAARTFDDDLTRVEAMGVRIVDGPNGVAGARSWTGSEPLFLMDTGPAAVLGALDDPGVGAFDRAMVVNLGNFHTIAAVLDGWRIAGLIEHHTGELTRERLEGYLDGLAAG